MARRSDPAAHRWVSLYQIAREIDRTPHQTHKLLLRLGFIGIKTRPGTDGRSIDYAASTLETVKGLLAQPHRHISDKPDDWLTLYLQGEHHGT